MKKLYVVLIVLALFVVGLGFYRGWIALSSSGADKGSNKVNLNLTVDPDKMKEDAQTVQEKTTELTNSVTGAQKTPDDHAGDNVKTNDP